MKSEETGEMISDFARGYRVLEITGFQKFPVIDNKYSERVERINQLSSVNWLLVISAPNASAIAKLLHMAATANPPTNALL